MEPRARPDQARGHRDRDVVQAQHAVDEAVECERQARRAGVGVHGPPAGLAPTLQRHCERAGRAGAVGANAQREAVGRERAGGETPRPQRRVDRGDGRWRGAEARRELRGVEVAVVLGRPRGRHRRGERRQAGGIAWGEHDVEGEWRRRTHPAQRGTARRKRRHAADGEARGRGCDRTAGRKRERREHRDEHEGDASGVAGGVRHRRFGRYRSSSLPR